MGAGAYSVGRRVAVMDAHTEKLISLLNSLRDKTRAISGADGPKCYGFVFEKNGVPKEISVPYKNIREGCDKNTQTNIPLTWQNDVKVKSLQTNGVGDGEKITILFAPPHGTIVADENDNSFTIVLQYKDRTRTIDINESSGRIEKVIN